VGLQAAVRWGRELIIPTALRASGRVAAGSMLLASPRPSPCLCSAAFSPPLIPLSSPRAQVVCGKGAARAFAGSAPTSTGGSIGSKPWSESFEEGELGQVRGEGRACGVRGCWASAELYTRFELGGLGRRGEANEGQLSLLPLQRGRVSHTCPPHRCAAPSS